MRPLLCTILLFFGVIVAIEAQQKNPLVAMPNFKDGNNYTAANYRIGCSLFTDPNNYTNGTTFTYNAPTNNNSNLIGASGTNYGCMYSVPNQVWYIITVTTGGNLYFNFTNSNNYDVDAVVWGPLANNDVANACSATLNTPLTCDYDAYRPDLYINNAQVGQKYVMLVTNYSNANTVINISQPTGGAVTYSMSNIPNCSLVPSATISGTSATINEGQSSVLNLSFTGSSPWTYTLSDGTTGTTNSSPLSLTVYPTASQTYTINSVNNLCGTSGGSGSVGISVNRNVQLKSCFPLDGNANDSQGINTGNLQNGVSATTNRANVVNKALQFDGSSGYANFSTNQLNNNTFAFASWVKLDELPDISYPERMALSIGGANDDHYLGVEYINGNPAWKFSSNGTAVYGTAIVNTNWHLLVGVRTGGQLKLYVDGSLSGTVNVSGISNYSSPLFGRIGSSQSNSKYFKGKIDDVKIFSGSLVDPEILLLQNYNTCSNVYTDTYISVQSISTSVICTGVSFIVEASTNNLLIDPDTQFTAELSDINGNFGTPTIIGSSSFLPLSVSIPNSIPFGNYKIRIRYGGVISVNTFDIFVNNVATYNVTGTTTLNDGQTTNINLNLTGSGPFNYVLSNGLSGVATTNPLLIPVSPDQTTTYTVSSVSNVCGVATLNGNNSATITVNFVKQLVSCLPFNGNANDENGNNTTTVNGPLLTANRYGQTNATYLFNGTNNYIEYTTNLLRKREYTMSAWVLASSLPTGTQYILSQGEAGTNTFQGLAMTSSGWQFQSTTVNGSYYATSSTGFIANQWVHLTAVRTYQSMKLYVNGNLVSTVSNSSNIPFKTSDIGRIGANSSSLGNYFNGKIDDVRLYKGALNDEEVYALYAFTNNCPAVENAPIIVGRGLSATTICSVGSINVSYSSSNVSITASNPLYVQLSDQNGSFANPTLIGSGYNSPISVTIPNNTVNSSFYKIRLISTSGTPVTSVNSHNVTIGGIASTASISGTATINEGQSTNLTLNFTGSSPWTYTITGGTSQTTSTTPLTISVSPIVSTTYSITSLSNGCGNGTVSGSAVVSVNPVPVRLISCFPFNGNATDTKGANTATVFEAALTTDRFGIANRAYYFDGINDIIQTSGNGMNNADVSISVWFSKSSEPAYLSYIFGIGSSNKVHSLIATGIASVSGYSAYPDYVSVSNSVSQNTWYHAVLTRSGSTLKLYLNGVSIGQTTISNSYSASDVYVTNIGGGTYNNERYFNGKIDDIQYYKGALTADQVSYLYASQLNCDDPTTVQMLTLNNLTGSPYCQNQSFTLSFTSSNIFPTIGSPINAELSDANGSFTNPTSIGSTTSPTGNITVQIPNNQAIGTAYKVRLKQGSILSNVSVNIAINIPVTATIAGTTTINEGQSTNLTLNFTGTAPYTYTITGGTSQTTSLSTVTIPVTPSVNTTYSITSLSNSCGIGVSSGSAVITVNAVPVRLVSCFPFNGNANDSKGINNGTVYGGATLTTDRFGNTNNAYNFDGIDDKINIGSNNIANPDYTISLWFNLANSTIQSSMGLFSIGANANNTIYYSNSTIRYITSPNSFSTNTLTFSSNTWYHLTLVRTANTFVIYLNGNSILTGTTQYSTVFDAFPLVAIGSGFYNLDFFQGKIDDVQIYKGALSTGQVQALYNSNNGCIDASNVPVLSLSNLASNSLCTSQLINITQSSSNVAYPIKVQLSDFTGSFAFPTELGTGNLSSIIATIPPTQTTSTNYKIRLVSSDATPIISNVINNITINAPVTASLMGLITINEGQSTNLTINFTGTPPYTYTITGGTSQTTSTNPLTIPVSPIVNTTYTITSLSNTCGIGSAFGSANITVNPVPLRLISCYPFNGNANDGKGVNNGSIIGNLPLTTDRFNNPNNAYNFSDNGYIQIDPAINIFNLEFTTSFWFQSSSNQALNSLYTLLNLSSNTIVLKRKGTGAYSIQFTGMSNFGADFYEFNLINYNPSQWHSLIFIHSFERLYVLIGNTPPNPQYSEATYGYPRRIIIGSTENYYWNFQGKIDDFQIYKGALSAGQVQALYNNNNGCYDASTYICPTNSAYNSILNGQQVLQVSNQITGNNTIQTGSNVHFDAGNLILLQPGFTTETNTVFKASVGGGCRN
jgi:Concanavalin A-like lectin/glucanases superfamily